jgi:hypothetical protein
MSYSEESLSDDRSQDSIKPKGFWKKFIGIAGKSLKIASLAVLGGIPAIIWGVGTNLLFTLIVMAANFTLGAVGTASVLFVAIAAAIKTAINSQNPNVPSTWDDFRKNFTPVVHLFLNSLIRTLSIGTVFAVKNEQWVLLKKANKYNNVLEIFLDAFKGFSIKSKGAELVSAVWSEEGTESEMAFRKTETKDILKALTRGEALTPFAKVIGCIKNEVKAINNLARDIQPDDDSRFRGGYQA